MDQSAKMRIYIYQKQKAASRIDEAGAHISSDPDGRYEPGTSSLSFHLAG
jgi:hypothetical protein